MTDLTIRWANARELLEDSPEYQSALRAAHRERAEASHGAVDPSSLHLVWLSVLAEAAYLVATADGHCSDEDKQAVTAGLVTITEEQLTASDIEEAFARASGSVHGGTSKLLHEMAEQVQESALREAVILVAFAASRSEGLSERQDLVLHALAHAFGFSEGKLQSLLSRARQAL